jgi:hypothetical protein
LKLCEFFTGKISIGISHDLGRKRIREQIMKNPPNGGFFFVVGGTGFECARGAQACEGLLYPPQADCDFISSSSSHFLP